MRNNRIKTLAHVRSSRVLPCFTDWERGLAHHLPRGQGDPDPLFSTGYHHWLLEDRNVKIKYPLSDFKTWMAGPESASLEGGGARDICISKDNCIKKHM